MKKFILLLICTMFFTAPESNAQFGNFIKKAVEKKVEKKVEEIVEEKIDEAVDGKKEAPAANNNNSSNNTNSTNAKDASKATGTNATLNWAKYDFVPGDEIIFEDDLKYEENGEFPSRWDISGGNVEIAEFGGENVIMFREGSQIIPFMKNRKSDYLPDEFTLEFDCFFEPDEYSQRYWIYFYDVKNQRKFSNGDHHSLEIGYGYESFDTFHGEYPGVERTNRTSVATWRHVSVSFNKGTLKAYMDDTRLLNVPRLPMAPAGFTFISSNDANKCFIKNIRFAKGAVKLYKRVMTEGKIIVKGIRFDVAKATLKPESIGPINKIFKIMKKDQSLKFSVEGHTDNDGDDATNLTLSKERAKSVMNKLISLGIDASRLKSTGHGESKPLGDNDSPEGKANNRRVEFIKF